MIGFRYRPIGKRLWYAPTNEYIIERTETPETGGRTP